jgi:hypothetical protein
MNQIPALTLWTDNYRPLYDRWLSTLPKGLLPVSKYFDTKNFSTFGFRHPSWYECIKQKLIFFVDTLNLVPMNSIVLCCDSDVLFLNKEDKLVSIAFEVFEKDPLLDIWIMREGSRNMVNGGFYFVRNSQKIIDYIKNLTKACDKQLPFADQTFLNETIKTSLTYQMIPDCYVVWGNQIHDSKSALFHHAVCCANVEQKLIQQDFILSVIKREVKN